ncbi:DUF4224 domain-containing protein [Streptomyces sp. NBC_00576]|uniref:DUF4224 domain-containing protein n=1 Tax=Streptomyces sp. NBC_00576 TaxID=2903665 RepID=UPI002E81C729|nr:hypothetical protein [Streptomyces sp. NBC_00576]WUB73502.1 hypothetical protein OG734_27390 [Streptomyces sp. NBC_00576]
MSVTRLPGTHWGLGQFFGPSFADWHADAARTHQVTGVGERADQAQWLADKVRAVLFDRTASGWSRVTRTACVAWALRPRPERSPRTSPSG